MRENNIYVEDLVDGRITKLTDSSSADEINGTFDWVYEEEFGLRDGFRWSPDGKFDRVLATGHARCSGVSAGQQHRQPLSADHERQVSQGRREERGLPRGRCLGRPAATRDWIDVPGDPRDNYIAYLEWAGNSHELVLQQFNRHQDTVRVMMADMLAGATGSGMSANGRAVSGSVRTADSHRAPDDSRRPRRRLDRPARRAALDSRRSRVPVAERARRLAAPLSRRAGTGRAETGTRLGLVTTGDFDVIGIVAVDQGSDSVYFTASPKNPTQRYLYRVKLDGTGLERVSPEEQPGTHDYQLSPDAKWAIDSYSAFDAVPTTALVRLPKHEKVRMLAENKALAAKLEKLESGRSEFFRVDIGGGSRARRRGACFRRRL